MGPRSSFALAAFLVVLGTTGAASAQQPSVDKKVCIAAAERGQELRDTNKMRDARSQFALCARKECPAAVAAECSKWVAEADAALATVKLDATDGQGKAVTGVKVIIDGAPWSDEVPVAPVSLDPGSHEIRFERAGSQPVVRTVSLAMGDRDRAVSAVFKTDGAAVIVPKEGERPEPRSGGSLAGPLIVGGVGVVALGAATAFWLMGNADLDDAKARCQNGCPDSDADSAKQKHLIGDIALGVGIVAIAAAAYMILTREKAPQPVLRFSAF
ncbi:MAG: hypothetical protein JWP87_3987 [Labilithrix sp.]|nr:hypothetical protein [Labilithrix sp.]